MNEIVLGISGTLNRLLEKKGISEAELGREIGVPRATINRITSGRTPDPRASTLKAIAEYFNVTVDQLLGERPLFTGNDTTVAASYASIPIIEWDKAIQWKFVCENISPANHTDWILTDPNTSEGKFALRIKGESMWPQFQENTILIIDTTKEIKNRDFVIVYIKKSNEILFRQIVVEGKYKFVKAINELFPAIQLQSEDVIIGAAIQTRNNIG